MQQTHSFSLGAGKRYRAAIFDFDGVILDTERYHFAAWNAAGALFGLAFSEEEYLPLKSTGRPYIASVFEKKLGRRFTEEEKRILFSEKQAYFEEAISSLGEKDLIAGAVPFLQALQERGVPAAVASSGTLCARLVERFGLTPYFVAVIGPEEGLPKKPAPDVFLLAAERLSARPSQCLVFEDSSAGMRAARAAGMDYVAIGSGEGSLFDAPDFCTVLGRLVCGET